MMFVIWRKNYFSLNKGSNMKTEPRKTVKCITHSQDPV